MVGVIAMIMLAMLDGGATTGMHEHFVLIVILFLGQVLGGILILGGGIQRHQWRHLGLFLAAIAVFLDLFVGFRLLGLFILGRRAGDLEALDIVFLAAAGLGLLFGQQRLPVGHGDLVIVGMDFGKGQETLAIAAIFDKGGLQRRFDPRHLGKIDVSFERPLGSGFEIKFLDFGTVENDHPGLFRVAGVDEHTFGHGNLRRARDSGQRHGLRLVNKGGANC